MKSLEVGDYILRSLTLEDVTEKYVCWLNNPKINKYLEIRHKKHSLKDCVEYVTACNKDENSHLFGVFDKEHDVHIGNAKIGFVNKYYNRGQISIFLGEQQYWGQGISTNVIKTLTEYAFIDLGLDRLEAGCYESNLGSLRAFLKNGYVVEGFMRNQFVVDGVPEGCFWVGMLKNDYKADK